LNLGGQIIRGPDGSFARHVWPARLNSLLDAGSGIW
jgi:hypothetical protein